MLETIKQILIRRDDVSSATADALIKEAHCAMCEYLDQGNLDRAYHVCEEYFGLEPDYLMELV